MALRHRKLVRLVLVALAAGGGSRSPRRGGRGSALARRHDASERSHDAPLVHAPGGEVGRRPPRRQRPPRRDGVREDRRGGDPDQRKHLLVGRPLLDDGRGGVPRAPGDPATDLRRRARARPQGVRPPPDGLPGGAAEVPGARLGLAPLPGLGRGDGLPAPARPRHRDRDHALRAGRSGLHARGVRVAGRPGDRGAPRRRPARQDRLPGPAARRPQPGPLELRDRLLPHGRRGHARPRRARQVRRLPGRARGPAVRGPPRGRGGGRQRPRRRRHAGRGGRERGDPLRGRGHELRDLQGRERRPRGTGEGRDGASVGTLARRDPPGPRRRAPASLPARVDRPRHDSRLRPAHGRAARRSSRAATTPRSPASSSSSAGTCSSPPRGRGASRRTSRGCGTPA